MEGLRSVVDSGVITPRNPGDLKAFSAKIIEEVKQGRQLNAALHNPLLRTLPRKPAQGVRKKK